MKFVLTFVFVGMLFGQTNAFADGLAVKDVSYDVVVIEGRTVAFAEPSHGSAALRLIYPGEILKVTGEVEAEGEGWRRIEIGPNKSAYVRAVKLSAPGDITRDDWRPADSIRDHEPFVVGLEYGGRTFGYGMLLRYTLMSRLGLTFNLGGVLNRTQERIHGGTWSLGIHSFLVLWNLSPMVEVGMNTVYYPSKGKMLRLWNLYAALGLEWMFDSGFFANVQVDFVGAISRRVSYRYDDFREGVDNESNFGIFEKYPEKKLSFVKPGVSIGWAF